MANGVEKIRDNDKAGSKLHSVRMTHEQVSAYIRTLLESGGDGLGDAEKTVLKLFSSASKEIAELDRRLSALTRERESVLERIKNLSGRCDGYAEVLVEVKTQREAEEIEKAFAAEEDLSRKTEKS
jgi:predicted CopG family antitoxin